MDSSPFVEQPRDPAVEAAALRFQLRDLQTQLALERLETEDKLGTVHKQLEETSLKNDELARDQIFYYNAHKELLTKLEHAQQNFQLEREKLAEETRLLKQQLQSARAQSEDSSTAQSQLRQAEQQKLMLRGELDQSAKMNEELMREVAQCHAQMNELKQKIDTKDEEITQLNNREAPSAEDIAQMQSISKQLSEQVGYIQELELKNLHQSESLKSLQLHKTNVEIIKNENVSLRKKLESLDTLKVELDSTTLELLQLKQEHSKWSTYLGDDEVQAEEFMKTFRSLKDENFILKNNLDKSKLELKSLQGKHNEVFTQNESLKEETHSLDVQLANISKINAELEQQRDLAFEESTYLREQLKSLDNELSLNEDDKAKYIANLERLVDEYKSKLDDLTKTIPKLPSNKRHRPDDTLHLLQQEQSLKDLNKDLETQVSNLMNENALLIKKLECIEDIKEQKVRILQLRNNPFLKNQVVKREQLEVLQRANDDLMGKLTGDSIPKSVYDQCQFEIAQLNRQIESTQKRNQRLTQTYNKKSLEMLQSISDLFGYKVSYMSDKIKLVSKYANGSLVIDPKVMSFKRTGDDLFVRKCDELIEYWIKEKREISCFLGALTMELYSCSS